MNAPARLQDIHDQAKGRWRALLPRFAVPTSALDGKQRPCPICGGKDRFRFDDKDGRGTWFCNVCGAGNGMTMVIALTGASFVEAVRRVREHLPDCQITRAKPARDNARCIRAAQDLWMSAVPLAGTMAEDYLRRRQCWSAAMQCCPDLRFAGTLRAAGTAPEAYDRPLPALLALVRDNGGEPVNVHRTYLDAGQRAYRAMMPGAVPDGAAIRLMPATDRIGVAEGLETAARAAIKFGVACWSAISSGNLSKFSPPPGTDQIDIFCDADRKFGGQAASYALAHRLSCQRHPVACEVHVPAFGTDWADEQPGERRAA